MKFEGMKPLEILHRLTELKPMKQKSGKETKVELGKAAGADASKNSEVRQANTCISQLIKHPLLREYKLSQRDVMVIVDLWQYHLEFPGRSSSWGAICNGAKIKRHQMNDCIAYVTGLLERNIINFDEKISGDYHLNPMILQSAQYLLGKGIVLRILGRDLAQDLESAMKDEWRNDDDFLADMRRVFDLSYSSFQELGNRSTVMEYPIISTCLKILKNKMDTAPETLGIKKLVRENNLSEDQLNLFLIIAYHQLYADEKVLQSDLVLFLAPNPKFRTRLQDQLNEESALVSNGLVCLERRFQKFQAMVLGISDEALSAIGYKRKVPGAAGSGSLSPFFHKCEPRQTLDDLIIPAADKDLIKQVIRKCNTIKQKELEKWGFKTERQKQGMVLLLYGVPGTGKTFAAGAIANELRRDLISLNVSALRNMYYGETEKLVRQAFTEMRKMASNEAKTPVFLLNEADQLIHERTSGISTASAVENSIQSIILEELETFLGFLILTTNLENNMDGAFFRRFDLKFEFRLPDLDSRRRLWKIYLRKEIPGSQDIDVEALAYKYQFSGAQISLVVQNACIEAIARSGKSRKLNLQDLLKYADLEQPWTNKINKIIGF